MDDVLQLLLILRARYKIVIAVALIAIIAGVSGGLLLPKRYTAETTVMVDIKTQDPVTSVLVSGQMAQGSMATQVDIVKSTRVALKVVRMLRLEQGDAVKKQWLDATEGTGKLEDWLADLMLRGLSVTPSRESNVLSISFKGNDPVFVTAVANAFAQAFIEASIELKVEPARQYARWFGDQSKVLRENMEKAQAKLSDYQQQHGIVATSEAVDYETTKLSELSTRLTSMQVETAEARSKQRLGRAATDTLPDTMRDSVTTGLRTDINRAESKLKEAAVNLGPNNPAYKKMESELAELRNRLELETKLVTSGFGSSNTVGTAKQVELRAEMEAQKTKLLQLKKERDEVAVLQRDVDAAKKQYDAVANRFAQTSLESQSTQTNVTVLTQATEPLTPSFPKPIEIILLASIGLGIVLGGAAAYGLEMVDRRIRSTADLAAMLQIPMLGVIARPRRPVRLAFWRRGTALALR